MPRLSASKLDLGALCLHWTTLEIPYEPSGRAAVLGNAFHELVATGRHKQELTPEEEALTAQRFAGWQKNGAKRLPKERRHEVAFAINAKGRVREIGVNIDRAYGRLATDEVPGSIDVYGEGRAIDFKTGARRVDAIVSGQLAFASAATGSPVVEFHYVNETGRTTVDAASVDPAASLKQVSRVALRLIEGETQPIAGDHCYDLFCPVRAVCTQYPYRKTNITTSTPMSNMSLSAVTRGRVKRPLKLLVYGPEGSGKSTLGSQAPDPIFLCAEDGTSQLDVARFPEPKSWPDVLAGVQELTTAEHSFKTLVIDSLDWLQPLMVKHVCEQQGITEDKYHAFGLGEKYALSNWKELIAALDELREKRGVHVVLIAHSSIVKFNNPEGEDFDRYQLALPNKAADLWKQWADVLLFLSWETLTKKGERNAKGLLGDRYLFPERTAAFDAKNRFGIREPIAIPDASAVWQAFSSAVKKAQANQANTNNSKPEQAA